MSNKYKRTEALASLRKLRAIVREHPDVVILADSAVPDLIDYITPVRAKET